MEKPKTCLDNLKNCDAACCKSNHFRTPKGTIGAGIVLPFMTKDMQYYYKVKGFKVFRRRDRKWCLEPPAGAKITRTDGLMVIKSVCPALKDNKCTLHGTDKKPNVCERFGNTTTKGYYVPKKCIFKSDQEWEKDMNG